MLDWIEQHIKPDGRIATTAAIRFLLGLLVEDMKQKLVPVTVVTLCQHLNRIPFVFDLAFPGYAEAGVASIIFNKSLTKDKF